MADDAHATNAEQWRSTVRTGIQRTQNLFEHSVVECRDLGKDVDDHRHHRFVKLEDNVAHESVAYDDVDRAVRSCASRHVTTFNVAVEIEPCFLKKGVGCFCSRIALLFLFTDTQKSHRRIPAAEDVLRIDGA